MNIEEYVAEVVKGINQAFHLALSEEEIGESLYEFDPMSEGRSLGIGGNEDLIKICGHPVEFVVVCEEKLPTDMRVLIIGKNTTEADQNRVYEIIEELEKAFGKEIMMNDVNEEDVLMLDVHNRIMSLENVSEVIVNTVKTLTNPKNERFTEELLRLCSK